MYKWRIDSQCALVDMHLIFLLLVKSSTFSSWRQRDWFSCSWLIKWWFLPCAAFCFHELERRNALEAAGSGIFFLDTNFSDTVRNRKRPVFDTAVLCCLGVHLLLEKINESKANLNRVQHYLWVVHTGTLICSPGHGNVQSVIKRSIFWSLGKVGVCAQGTMTAPWHGGGAAGPALVLVWLAQAPISMTGCNVSY